MGADETFGGQETWMKDGSIFGRSSYAPSTMHGRDSYADSKTGRLDPKLRAMKGFPTILQPHQPLSMIQPKEITSERYESRMAPRMLCTLCRGFV